MSESNGANGSTNGLARGDEKVRVGVGVDVAVEGRVVVGAVVCWSRDVTEITDPLVTAPVGLIAVTVASALVEPDSETPNPRPAN